ncbi:MAG: hypothetical protein R2804_06215 [Cyclobacteriaceae bacterium]
MKLKIRRNSNDNSREPMDWLSQRIVCLKKQIAEFLGNRINTVTSFKKKIAFLVAGIAVGLICLELIYRSTVGEKTNTPLTIDQITQPIDINPALDSIADTKD